jgi:malonyl CoA-acyl carrier protein transacylase
MKMGVHMQVATSIQTCTCSGVLLTSILGSDQPHTFQVSGTSNSRIQSTLRRTSTREEQSVDIAQITAAKHDD